MSDRYIKLTTQIAVIAYIIYVFRDLLLNFPHVNHFTSISLLTLTNVVVYIFSKVYTIDFKINGQQREIPILIFVYVIASSVLAIYYPWIVLIAFVASFPFRPLFLVILIFLEVYEPPGSFTDTEIAHDVELGASAPTSVMPDSEFTARFFAYSPTAKAPVKEMILQMSPETTVHTGIYFCQWEPNTIIKVRLYAEYLSIDPFEQTFIWKGTYNILSFDVRVPKDIPKKNTVLKFDVLISEIIIARIRCDLSIEAGDSIGEIKITNVKPYQTAFASYASQDREIVLHRVSEIQRNGIEVFLDCITMRAGVDWKASLENEIRNRETFMLFWSENAMASEWVKWEWETALAVKGISAIDLHPLTTVDKAPPPAELKSLHFGDVHMLVNEAFKR